MKTKFLFLAVLFAALTLSSCNNENEVRAVRLDKVKLELVKGETAQLKASVVPEQGTDVAFEWFSEDPDYVTVDEAGLVTAVAVKKVDEDSDDLSAVSVFVKYADGADECEVTVLPLAAKAVEIIKSGSSTKLNAGSTVQLEVKITPEDADLRDLTWTTSDATVAVVSQDGVVTGKNVGFCEIKAAYSERIYDYVQVVVEPVAAESVKLEPSALSVHVGQKATIKAVLTPSYATDKLIWTSSDQNVVKIHDSALGMIEAVAAGNAKVRVSAGSKYAECEITVVE